MEIEFEKLLEAGNKLFDSGQFKRASRLFEKAIKLNPNSDIAQYQCGLALQRLGQCLDARNRYKKAIKLNPQFYDAYSKLGIILGNLFEHKEAIKQFKQAIVVKPDFLEAYINYGVALRYLKKYREAIDQFKQALKIDPHCPEAYCNWGSTLAELGEHRKAIYQHKKAIKINPDYSMPYLEWGSCLYKLGKFNEAIKRYKLAIKVDPQLADAHYGLGICLTKLQFYEEAIESYKQATKFDSQYAEAYGNWGTCLSLLKKRDRALGKYNKAFSLAFDKVSKTCNDGQEFFKFIPISKQTLLNFADKKVFFQNPNQFNDPFDCPIISQYKLKLHKALEDILLKIRVFSLGYETKRNIKPFSNMLMWSHYADQHKGLCVGYKFKPELFKKHKLCIADIVYTKKISQEFWESLVSTIESGYFQKYEAWNYEHEARIIWLPKKKNDSCIPLSDGIEISSVTFGYKASSSDIALVRQLLGDRVIYFKAEYDGTEKLGRLKIKA
jgi:tetratricopeptide (TPR) repeat protein